MKIPYTKFAQIVNQYAIQSVVPSMDVGLLKFLIAGASEAGVAIDAAKSYMVMFGILDKDGAVDVDLLEKIVNGGFKHVAEVPVNNIGLKFDKDEGRKLIEALKRG